MITDHPGTSRFRALLLDRSAISHHDLALARPSHLKTAITRCYPKMADIALYHLIARAVEVGASDVHIEPVGDALTVRYRRGGILEPVFTLPADAATAVRNRYKVMARADIAVKNRPQDGACRLKSNGYPIDVRMARANQAAA